MSDIKLTSIRVLLMCVIIHGLLMIDGKGKHELDTEVVHQAWNCSSVSWVTWRLVSVVSYTVDQLYMWRTQFQARTVASTTGNFTVMYSSVEVMRKCLCFTRTDSCF